LTKRNLSDASGGAIIFTETALSSWADSKYPYTEKMQASLVTLAKAACAYRETGGSVGGRLADWLHAEYGLRMSNLDAPLRQLGLDRFHFEGVEHSREPHLKLDDSTTPDRVGRVYFATDSQNLRFIVDHVGLKLYGL
jgi:hypothetical protein